MDRDLTHIDRLAALMQGGDQEAFHGLYLLFHTAVYSYCRSMLSNSDAAKDATQEVFLRVLRDGAGLKDATRFRGWLFGIARHQVLMALRERNNGRHHALDKSVQDGETPLEIASRKDTAEIVVRAVGSLPAASREAILLRDFQHLSYQEIAIATGSTEIAVKSRLHKARKHLAEKLAPYFDAEDLL